MRRRSRGWLCCVLFCAALMISFSARADAQGAATTTLAGTVVDSSGAMIPGADVVAKNNATATEYRAVTDSTGHFNIAALSSGTYTVTVSLMGFKTVSLPDVVVIPNLANSVKPVVLEVGQVAETITVTGSTELLQTQSATVATTLNTAQVSKTPLPTRNTMDFVIMLPGVSTTGAPRYSTIMGLPGSALNITIDGLNVQDQTLKSSTSSSFFAYINPRIDAVEEVTLSTSNPGAESSGQGAVQVRFQTRSGTNQYGAASTSSFAGPRGTRITGSTSTRATPRCPRTRRTSTPGAAGSAVPSSTTRRSSSSTTRTSSSPRACRAPARC